MAQIYVFVEEFYGITQSKKIDFHNKYDVEGTPAFQFFKLMRAGRSQGISLCVATQRANYDDIPSHIKAGITSWFVFKVNNPSDAAAVDVKGSEQITSDSRGKCATENGLMQYPYLNKRTVEFIDSCATPFDAVFASTTLDGIREALSMPGLKGLVAIKKFSYIVDNTGSLPIKDIGERYLKEFGFDVKDQKNDAYQIDLIAERDGIKYGVLLEGNEDPTTKKNKIASIVSKHLKTLKLDSVIILDVSDRANSRDLESIATELDGYHVDYDNVKHSCEVLDKRDEFESKEEFDEEFADLVLNQKKTKPDGPSEPEDKSDDTVDLKKKITSSKFDFVLTKKS